MTKKILETKNLVVEIEQLSSIKSISIWIRNKETREILKHLSVMDIENSGAWLCNDETLIPKE